MKRLSTSRFLNLAKLLKHKSYILLGPRQTGKSFIIREQLPNIKKYNLLLKEDFKRLSFDPTLIRKELTAKDKIIVIDEIQRLPELLDEVQYMIEEKGIRFLLTGSSARKLKDQNINLLGGRARFMNFHPFTFLELKNKFSLDRALNYGLIPGIYFSEQPDLDLDAYLGSYIEQEIAREGVVRNLTAFTRFLEVAALCNAELINYTSISNDAQVPRTTIHEYFKILEDTLIGYALPAWKETKKRKPIATSKFYFFDWAIAKQLQGLKNITEKSEIYGKAFESYFFHELKTFCDYNNIKDLHFWRTQSQDEVDFIIDNKVAVEVKASKIFKKEHIKSLIKLRDENMISGYYVVYLGKTLVLEDYPWVRVINYQEFLKSLYAGDII